MKIIYSLIAILLCSYSFSQIPSLTIEDKKQKQELEITSLKIDIEVVGNIATTTYDLLFYNPLSRNLEGDFSFPLNEFQDVSRYALDINGVLREGVVINKVKARQSFEAVIRQNIDPGIASKTKGNFFKTRIFPIPSKGTKRVVFSITETLKLNGKNLTYNLPMDKEREFKKFSLNVKIIKSSIEKPIAKPDNNNSFLKFDNTQNAQLLSFERENYFWKEAISFSIPQFTTNDHEIYTSTFENETYFYFYVKAPHLIQSVKKRPKYISIFWDNSFSASKRNQEKELQLLKKYLESWPEEKTISLRSFHINSSSIQTFTITKNASKLINAITKLNNDGATQLQTLYLNPNTDEILFFSDGINTIGTDHIKTKAGTPIYCISSSSGNNYSLLKKMARNSFGEFINLNSTSIESAIETLNNSQEKFLSCTFNPSEINETYPASSQSVGKSFEISGKLKTEQAIITISYGLNGKINQSQSFLIEKKNPAPIQRIWAAKKIQELELDFDKNKIEIENLGKKFSIVTRNTSFIVLDRIEDYVQYEIVPPLELQKKYFKLLARKKEVKEPSKIEIEKENLKRIKELQRWYSDSILLTDHQFIKSLESEILIEEDVEQMEVESSAQEVSGNQEGLARRMPPVATENLEMEGFDEYGDVAGNEFRSKALKSNQSSIKVLAWLPKAPYLDTLRKTEEKELETTYFRLKKQNLTRPSFYIQVSDYFFEIEKNKLATRVLSNILELDLENPELLKTTAKRMLQEGEYDLAIKIYKEIIELRPEEPQSHRDLAIAYIENKNYQNALTVYASIMSKKWGRFEAVKDVIFNELNALVSMHNSQLDLKQINKEYLKEMPLDIRITIDWSSNENDIDLWVIDPNSEKCFYSHKNTKIGGKMSTDFTRGYGPEEFTLKNAKRGFYTVFINYYGDSRQTIAGPVMVYATLTTNYGRNNEKREYIAIELKNKKETLQIGQMEWVDLQ